MRKAHPTGWYPPSCPSRASSGAPRSGSLRNPTWPLALSQNRAILSLCELRLPFLPGARPQSRIIREQRIERDPELAG